MRAAPRRPSTLEPSPAAASWRDLAVCGDIRVDPNLFDYPDLPNGLPPAMRARQTAAHVAMAREHCDRCPVTAPCLQLGMERHGSGVYAGVLLLCGEAVVTHEAATA